MTADKRTQEAINYLRELANVIEQEGIFSFIVHEGYETKNFHALTLVEREVTIRYTLKKDEKEAVK